MKPSPETRAIFALSMGVAVLIGVGSAAAAASDKPVRVEDGNLIMSADGGLKPKAISRKSPTPVGFYGSGKVETRDGAHPWAVRELIIKGDENVTLDTTGYPTCKAGELESRATNAAEAACKSALIGRGTTTVTVELPARPIDVDSKLLVFNGGTAGGVTTLYVHAYFSAPVTNAIVTTVKVRKINKGRYGTLAVATIPEIAGGSGSATAFDLTIDRRYTYKGKKMSVFMAKCPNGSVQANVTAKFARSDTLSATLLRSCTSKG